MNFCQYCGAPQEQGSRFCANCGKNLADLQYQAPQYQTPQYQAPVYPQYQMPQYPPTPYQPVSTTLQANRSAARRLSLVALILCFTALVSHFLAMIIVNGIYKDMSVDFSFPFRNYVWTAIACCICAVFPLLTMLNASSNKPQSGKNLYIGAVIFLVVQIFGVVLGLVSWILIRTGNYGYLYTIISRITSLIAGSNLITDLIYTVSNGSLFLTSNLLYFVSSLLYWGGSILSLAAALKLKKA